MNRWSLVAVLGPLVATGALAVAPTVQAGASPEVIEQVAHDAQSLAARIRHDARRGGSANMTSVKVIKGCCGVRALEVYERARAGHFARYGAYNLELVTGRGGKIEKIAIHEFPTRRGYNFEGEVGSPTYSIDIGPSRGHWEIGVSHAYHVDDNYTTGKVVFHDPSLAELTVAEIQTLYDQALAVVKKAENHAPVSEEAYLDAGLPCGLPEHQACEPGGRW